MTVLLYISGGEEARDQASTRAALLFVVLLVICMGAFEQGHLPVRMPADAHRTSAA